MSEKPARIPLCEPVLGGREAEYLQECVTTNMVSSVGPFVERFERAFATRVGAKHAVACATGTAALHVALRLFDVKPGDEVFVPTLTFIASANPVAYEHATPVLVDAERATWNLDPLLVVEELDARARRGARPPKVVEAVHLLGHPADMAELAAACQRHGVILVEDAAESLGASYVGGPFDRKSVGTIGQVGCFSFNGNKVMTTGGGGMIVTDDDALARRAKHLTTQARLPGAAYWHDEVGFNYRLTNVAAALGVAQLERLDLLLEAKRAIAERYDACLSELPMFTPPPRLPWARSSVWLYSTLLDTSDRATRLRAYLEAHGIDSRPIWSPLHLMIPFGKAPRIGGSVAEDLASRVVSLPCSANLTTEAQERVTGALRSFARS